MTLIAAFQCTNGIVICADSQETVDIPERGQYRVQVNKIQPQQAGEYDLVIGGGGDGPLVDGFTDLFADSVRLWEPALSLSTIKSKIQTFVRDYHRDVVALSPACDDDKHLGFVICLRQRATSHLSLWRVVELTVTDISDLTLLGWEEPLYWREAKRLYNLNGLTSDKPTSSEAILLSVHLFSIAKETSNVISGATRILVANDSGVRALNQNDVSELEARVKLFEHLTSAIFLALPDVTVTGTELKRYLRDFQETTTQLHDQFTLHIARTAFERMKGLPLAEAEERASDPYLQLPSLEQIKKSHEEDEAILAVRKMADDYKRQLEAESGWEQLTVIEKHQLFLDLRDAAQKLNSAAKLNRALYQAGQYGNPEDRETIACRAAIASNIGKANDQLTELLEALKPEAGAEGTKRPV